MMIHIATSVCYLLSVIVIAVPFLSSSIVVHSHPAGGSQADGSSSALPQQHQQGQQRQHPSPQTLGPNQVLCHPSSSNLTTVMDILTASISPGLFLRPAFGGIAYKYNASQHIFLQPGHSSHHPVLHQPELNSSLSPYHLTIRTLPRGYYPPSVLWAQCLCTKCRGHNALGCVTVFSEAVVLRPSGCLKGMQLYEERIIPLATSCACVNPVATSVSGGSRGGSLDAGAAAASAAAAAASAAGFPLHAGFGLDQVGS